MRQKIELNQHKNYLEPPKDKVFYGRFLRSGPKLYSETQNVINIEPAVLKELAKDHIGVPVIINHQDVTYLNKKDIQVGTVSDVFINDKGFTDDFGKFHEADDWAWCKFVVTDPVAIDLLINQGWELSNEYYAEQTPSEKQIADTEIVKGSARHLAIVPKGRYETKTILNNSKPTTKISMKEKLFNAISNVFKAEEETKIEEQAQTQSETIVANAAVEPTTTMDNYNDKFCMKNGKKIMINELIEMVREKKKIEEMKNEMKMEDEIEIDGEKMSVSNALEFFEDMTEPETKEEEIMDLEKADIDMLVDNKEEVKEETKEETKEEIKTNEEEPKKEVKEEVKEEPKKNKKILNSDPNPTAMDFLKAKALGSRAEDNNIKSFYI